MKHISWVSSMWPYYRGDCITQIIVSLSFTVLPYMVYIHIYYYGKLTPTPLLHTCPVPHAWYTFLNLLTKIYNLKNTVSIILTLLTTVFCYHYYSKWQLHLPEFCLGSENNLLLLPSGSFIIVLCW